MPLDYAEQELLHADNFSDAARWHHEGIGSVSILPGGGMRLHCLGSAQGAEGCMAFFRPDLPDRPGPRAALTVSAIPPVSPEGGELLHESRVKTDLPP